MVRRLSQVPIGPGEWSLAEDVEYETVKEDWNIYQLRDGTVLRIKLTVQKISRVLDDDKESIRYNEVGEPIYNVRHQVALVAEVPETLIKNKLP